MCSAQDISIDLATLGIHGSVAVRDIWARADVGTASGSFTAKAVPCHGTAFFKFTPQ